MISEKVSSAYSNDSLPEILSAEHKELMRGTAEIINCDG